jgi:glycerophosphoryl diester phosphodiesterase
MTLVLGHRGASAARPENTIAAFLEAREQGADGVELDVRRSRDGGLVVHHDAELADGRAICELDVADLPSEICLLGAALDACAGLLVNIEIKNVPVDRDYDPTEYLAREVAALVGERKLHGSVLVSSFSLDAIDRVAELDADIRCGYLTSATWNQAHCLARAVEHGHEALHPYHLTVNRELVEAAHAQGIEVNTWTVDDPDRIRWLAREAGVDAVITNAPDVALAAHRSRPQELREDEVEDVRLVAELEALGLAEVVAVDLVREGPVPDGDG